MKKRYYIGFFAAIFSVMFFLGIGYRISYQQMLERQEAKWMEDEKENLIVTKGEAQKNEGYYVKELHGCVAVYYGDRETLYELTEIPLTDLPEEVQEEVRVGKYLATMQEMYGFLENYSS